MRSHDRPLRYTASPDDPEKNWKIETCLFTVWIRTGKKKKSQLLSTLLTASSVSVYEKREGEAGKHPCGDSAMSKLSQL